MATVTGPKTCQREKPRNEKCAEKPRKEKCASYLTVKSDSQSNMNLEIA